MNPEERDLLIRTVLGEAEGEPPEGQAAVAHVVLNRVRSGKFGGRIRDVVLAPNQFEPWQTKRAVLLSISKDSPRYQKIARVVDAVLAGNVPDPTDGATHFLNADIVKARQGELPEWAVRMSPTAQKIGRHTFLGGGQKLAQNNTMTDAGPSPSALDRARAILGDKGPRKPSPQTPGLAQIDAPRQEYLDRAKKLLAPEPEKKEAAPPKSFGEKVKQFGFAAVDTLTDAATLGAGDELQALSGAAFEGGEGTFGERYSRILERNRARRREFSEEHPVLSTVGRAAADIGTAVVAAPVAAEKFAVQLARLGFSPATTTTGRVAQAAAGGSAVGTAAGFLDSEGGFLNRAAGATLGAGIGGTLGAGASAAVGLIQRVIEPLLRSGKAVTNGVLSQEARAALASAGIDPDEAGNVLATFFEERARRGGLGAETARRAAADEFGVPLSTGQATGSFDEIAFEEAAKSGSRGAGAGNVARTFEDQQREAIGTAREALVPGGRTAAEAGETVRGGLESARGAAKEYVRQGYDAVPRGTVIDVKALSRLEADAQEALDGVTLNASPQAKAALAEISKLRGKARVVKPAGATGVSIPNGPTGDSAKVVGIDFLAVEGLRKRLNAIARRVGQNDAQAAFEIDTIRKSLDGWIDRSVSEALISGDDAALAAVKEARSRYAAYRRVFTQQGAGDDAGRAIEAMTDPRIRPDGITPREVTRFLYGAARVGASGQSVRVARRIGKILGKDSEEWAALRQGAWQEIVSPKASQEIGAQALSSRILDFTKGDGAALARELFTADEIQKMNRFANVLRMTVPPKRATNPSGTGAAIARTVQDSFNAITTGIGVASGNMGAAFGSRLLSGVLASRGGRGRALANFNPAGKVATRVGPRQAATFAGGLLGGQTAGGFFSQ